MGRGLSKLSGGGAMNFTDHNSFFGNVHNVSNKYFTPEKQVIDNDNIILVTNNVKAIKGNTVMVVGPNQAIYVNNIAGVNVKDKNGNLTTDSYAVKINRNKYKTYTFRGGFDEFGLSNVESFDDLLKVAKSQEKAQNQYSTHTIWIGSSRISHK